MSPTYSMFTFNADKQVSDGKILDNNVPVFVITFATQEMLLFRNALTREIVVGAENKVEQCHYVAVLTRVEDDLSNELTGGWKVMEECRLFLAENTGLDTYVCVVDGPQICSGIFVELASRSVCFSDGLDSAPSLQYLHATFTTHNHIPIHYISRFCLRFAVQGWCLNFH